jgi:hypothetical protein
MVILGHTLSVLHLSISVDAPNLIFHTVDESMSVRRGVFGASTLMDRCNTDKV